MSCKGLVCLITGGSRGIGRDMALTFAREGAHAVVVAAKSIKEKPNLPGTIFSVAKEIDTAGSIGVPLKMDVLLDSDIEHGVETIIKRFGRIDVLVNNAGALWWKEVVDTPMKRYDLINGINARAPFALSRAVLPSMLKHGYGRIIMCSPPIDPGFIKGKVGYSVSKFGATIIAHGLAEEVRGTGVTSNALWPATAIESFATKNFKMGNESMWRKASILSDAAVEIIKAGSEVSGQALIDEDFLRSRGVSDFKKYRCDPNVEPPRISALSSFSASKPGEKDVTYRSKL